MFGAPHCLKRLSLHSGRPLSSQDGTNSPADVQSAHTRHPCRCKRRENYQYGQTLSMQLAGGFPYARWAGSVTRALTPSSAAPSPPQPRRHKPATHTQPPLPSHPGKGGSPGRSATPTTPCSTRWREATPTRLSARPATRRPRPLGPAFTGASTAPERIGNSKDTSRNSLSNLWIPRQRSAICRGSATWPIMTTPPASPPARRWHTSIEPKQRSLNTCRSRRANSLHRYLDPHQATLAAPQATNATLDREQPSRLPSSGVFSCPASRCHQPSVGDAATDTWMTQPGAPKTSDSLAV